MKIKFIKNTTAAGRIYNAGEEHDVDSALGATCVKQGLAETATAPATPATPTTGGDSKKEK